MKNFKKLKIWQKGMEIIVKAYALAKQLPKEERFGLSMQMRKAAVSIPSNIAEGSAKSSIRDNVRFLEISLGSAYELETQVIATEILGYGDPSLRTTLLKDVDEEQRMIRSYINRLQD